MSVPNFAAIVPADQRLVAEAFVVASGVPHMWRFASNRQPKLITEGGPAHAATLRRLRAQIGRINGVIFTRD